MTSKDVQTDTPVDLTNCDKEPIHIPSRIQPYGVLLTLREPEWTILQASANTHSFFGKSPQELFGASLEILFGADQVAAVRERCRHENLDKNPLYIATLTLEGQERSFDCIVHRIEGVLALELEPAPVALPDDLNHYLLVKKVIPRLQAAQSVQELCEVVVRQMRQMCRYDRVMIYQFDAEGHGCVVAEDRRDDLEPFLGLHYPASDIPQQARRLYELNPIRLLADVNYTPVDVLPNCNALTGKPLDMSYCLLRSVSPIHIEYLQNMGVAATLGISLLQEGRLWGLIICHHYAPLHLSYSVRAGCEFLGQIVSMQLSAKRESDDEAYRLQMQKLQKQLVALMMEEKRHLNGLSRYSPNLLDLMEVSGAVICMKGEYIRLGETPDDAFLAQMTGWLSANSTTDVLVTNHLSQLFPAALAYREIASGLLALTISREQEYYLLWFRPEAAQSVEWAGDPNKAGVVGNDGVSRLTPRRSFAAWQEAVRNRSVSWKQLEIEAATNLRHALIGVELAHTTAQQEQQFVTINEQIAQNQRLHIHLQERTERLHLATESGELGIWEYNIVSNLVGWDERMMLLHGISPDTSPITYGTWSERLHPDDRARAEAELGQAIREGKKFDTEFRIVWPDGTIRHIKANAVVLKDESQTPVRLVGINQDITERKRQEDALRASEERWQLALKGNNDGIWDWNIITNTVFFSPRWKEMLGWEAHEVADQFESWSSLVHPEDLPLALEKIQAYLEGKTSIYSYEHRMRHKNGSWVWILTRGMALFDADGKPYRMTGSHTDITRQKEAQEELRLLSTVVAESICGILITDAEERVVYVNPAFEQTTGYSLEEMRGRRPGEILQGKNTDLTTRKRVREALQAQQLISVEILNYHKSGEPYWLEMHIAPVLDSAGKLQHFVAIENDITLRKRAEEELRHAQERLQGAQRVARLGNWEYDINTNVISWSEGLFHILGLDPAHGEPDYASNLALYHPQDALRLDACVQKAISEGREYELDLRRASSEGQAVRWYHATGQTVKDADGKVIQLRGTLQDITDRRQAQQQLETAYQQLGSQIQRINEQTYELEMQKGELQEANKRLTALSITDGLTGLHNHRAFQERLAEEFDRAQRYKAPVSLLLLDVDKFKSYNDTFGHPEGDVVLKTVARLMQQISRETDYICRYGGEEFVIILPETNVQGAIAAAERFRTTFEKQSWKLRRVTASFGVATFHADLITPQELIMQADKALYASKRNGRNRTTHFVDIALLQDLDSLEANRSLPYSDIVEQMLQIQQDSLTSSSEQMREMLANAYDATILSWSRLLDMKDKETEGHSARVTRMMTRLARMAGMNEEEVMYARWGALLHDVGKMSVPDAILHKPGPLTDEEWVIMRQHTTVAYEMLSPVAFLLPALDIPYCHHEKWDGTGYPRGLQGQEIPLAARLFALVDIYDALTSDRPYRKAWSKSKTVAHLRSLSGTHFDPRALRMFLKLLTTEKSANPELLGSGV